MHKGTIYILLSTLLFFVAQLMVKTIPTIPAVEIVLFRALTSFILCSYFIHQRKLHYFGHHKRDLILRGVFGTLGLLTFFYSLQHLPLATASTLIQLNPIFVILFAIVLVGEKPNPKQWIYFFMAFLGIVLLRMGTLEINIKDFCIGASSAVFAGVAHNFIRRLKNKEDPQTIILYLALVAIPFFGPLTYFQWVPPTTYQWTILIGIGLITQLAQVYLTKAYIASQASHIVHFTYIGVILSVIFGWLLFDETVTTLTLASIALIIFCIFMIHKNKHAT